MSERLGGRKADRAGIQRFADNPAHPRNFRLGGGPLHRVLAHHIQPHRRMSDQRAVVDRGAAFFQRVEILRKRFEWPVVAQTALQRRQAHPLDFFQRAHDQPAMLGMGWRHAKAAIAEHHRGDAMPRRNRQHPVPQNLGVVMSMDIDEARRHGQAAGVDRAGRVPANLAQGRDFTRLDSYVACNTGLARAVDYGSAADFQIVVHRGLRQVRAYSCDSLVAQQPFRLRSSPLDS
jgi:hypothetical protein